MNRSGYAAGSNGGTGVSGGASASAPESGLHARLKRQYLDYLGGKNEEIKEQKQARAYYHGAQWTEAQVRTFNKRKQPVVTYNRVGRKINAIVGWLEKTKRDPRGFPRTPQHEEGAELATAVLRYVCDQQRWGELSPVCGMEGARDGIGGVELTIEAGDMGDPEIGLESVDPSSFFYDPRSLKPDFSDARYMGLGKWIDLEAAIELFPDKEQELRDSVDTGYDLTSDPASDNKWVSIEAGARRIRLVDHWYISRGQWRWCLYTGSVQLDEGESYLIDEMRKTICRYIMFSAFVDQDGDRYGFVRGMKSAQDEINMRRSKGLHQLNSRRLIMEDGQGVDVEKTRAEAAKPDGIILYPPGTKPPEFDDGAKNAELNGQMLFLEDAKNEIENYGFNPALMGTGVQDMSGKAIQLLQQAGFAELGPFMFSYVGWKLRVYRAIWNAVRQHWTSQRWIRVTDSEKVAQFFEINKPLVDEFGQPVVGPDGMQALENAIGELDVDILIDEGPDTINAQQETFEMLKELVPALAPMLTPELAQAVLRLLILNSALPADAKSAFRDVEEQAQQPNPQQQMAEQLQMRGAAAEVQETEASAKLKQAQALKAMAEAQDVGADREANAQERMFDVAAQQQDQQFRREEHAMDMEGKRMDLAGKAMQIKASQQRANQPQQGAR